jgi:hypothetical protein
MDHELIKIEPGTPLIYERVDDTVYARFAGRSDIPRWIVREEPSDVINSFTLRKINDLAKEDPRFKNHIEMILKDYGLI